jgi:predicted PurR-regulated permease PerM
MNRIVVTARDHTFPMTDNRLAVPRWVQLVMLPLAVLGAWALVRAAGPVVLLFTIAGLVALLLNPFVALLRRRGLPRGLSVLIVMLCVVAVLIGVGILLSNPVSDQVSAFRSNVPDLVDDANASLDDLQAWLDRNGIDVQIAEEGEPALQSLGAELTGGSGELLSFTEDALRTLVEASIALILVIVLSVYMLLYGERIGASVRSAMPFHHGAEDDYPARVQRAVFGYVRGQLLFSLIMGTSAGLMLWVLGSLGIFPEGKTYALLFGAWYGFAELIPYIGPAIGAAPPVLIALFSGEALDAVWLVIAFTALQQIEGHIVAPNVFAQALRINPILVILALLLGGQLYGFIGAFVALPIAAILRETVVYFRTHLRFESWDLPAAAGPVPDAPEPERRCPECGAAAPTGARHCPACGTELGEPDAEAAATSAAPG